MKHLKKLVVLGVIVGLLGAAGVAYAATQSPADILSGLTGKTVAELNQERAAGETYGKIASDAGKLEEFKQQMLAQKKAILDQRVTEGRITQEQATQIYNTIQSNQATCDGTGSGGIGRKSGAAFGQGQGMRSGLGAGQGGAGCGMGFGRGMNR